MYVRPRAHSRTRSCSFLPFQVSMGVVCGFVQNNLAICTCSLQVHWAASTWANSSGGPSWVPQSGQLSKLSYVSHPPDDDVCFNVWTRLHLAKKFGTFCCKMDLAIHVLGKFRAVMCVWSTSWRTIRTVQFQHCRGASWRIMRSR